MEKLSVGTEGQGFYMERNDVLKFKNFVITFHLKALSIVKSMKQTKIDSGGIKECKNKTEYFLENLWVLILAVVA